MSGKAKSLIKRKEELSNKQKLNNKQNKLDTRRAYFFGEFLVGKGIRSFLMFDKIIRTSNSGFNPIYLSKPCVFRRQCLTCDVQVSLTSKINLRGSRGGISEGFDCGRNRGGVRGFRPTYRLLRRTRLFRAYRG